MQYATILKTITSVFDERVYLRAGETVEVISDHVNVLIVKRKTGERVSVRTDNVIELPEEQTTR